MPEQQEPYGKAAPPNPPGQATRMVPPAGSGVIKEGFQEIMGQLGILDEALANHEKQISPILLPMAPQNQANPKAVGATPVHQLLVNIIDRIRQARQYVEDMTLRAAL